jgi:competence protein ComEC
VLAVSGMHCGFLLGLIRLLAGRHRRRLVAACAVGVLILYALLTGASPSVLRACVMLILLVAAPLFGRERDGPTSLAAALMLILLANPFAACSISLQLSFAAVAGILFLSPRLYRMLLGRRKRGKVFSLIAASFSATMGALIFTVPLSAFYFGTLVLISPVSNLLCLWAATAVFIGAMMSVLVSIICWPLAMALGWIPGLLANIFWRAHGCWQRCPVTRCILQTRICRTGWYLPICCSIGVVSAAGPGPQLSAGRGIVRRVPGCSGFPGCGPV